MPKLAVQAMEGSIAVEDLSGGTFTVSNLGSLGVELFTPVLNPPPGSHSWVQRDRLEAGA
jgi:pyruvate dehydrogenase E2 component (dihydrolipoamide acetyltransferase)